MPSSTYPYAANDPGLRTCGGPCGSRVYYTAMCIHHGVCFTCENKAEGVCKQPVIVSSADIAVEMAEGDENPVQHLYDYEEAQRRERGG